MNRGFTLIELIVVIAIIGVSAAFVTLNFIGPQAEARDTQRKSDAKQYQNSLEIYANKNQGAYPVSVSSTSMSGICESVLNLDTCPDDPKWASDPSSNYKYQTDVAGSRYVVYVKTEKPTEGYFVVCSDGSIGENLPDTWAGPANGQIASGSFTCNL